ncbi:MAG: serine hydrolase domain-containing protein [bacterium]
MKKFITQLIMIIAVSMISCSTDPEVSIEQELQNALDNELRNYNGKGATAAVLLPGREIWVGATGISHEGAPITKDMVFCIASVTKSFTATLILQLMEEGKLSLGDSLKKWLPDFPNINSNITIKQLLNHTSGIFNYTMNPEYDTKLDADLSKLWTPEETITTFVLNPYCVPGAGYNYSNTNYLLLGMIIKEVTGSTVSNELRSRILSPLGLNLSYLPVEETERGTRAHPWLDFNDDNQLEDCSALPQTAVYSINWTAGAIHSTAEELVRFSNALLHEKTLLTQTTIDQMLDFYPVGGGLGYGLGISITPDFLEGVQGIGVDGASPGYGARMVYIPSAGISITVMINMDEGYDCKAAISRALAQVALNHN